MLQNPATCMDSNTELSHRRKFGPFFTKAGLVILKQFDQDREIRSALSPFTQANNFPFVWIVWHPSLIAKRIEIKFATVNRVDSFLRERVDAGEGGS